MAGQGIDYKFVHEVQKDLVCGICSRVLQQPQMVNCCEKRFCEGCLSEWMARVVSCPQCRSTEFCHMSLKKLPLEISALEVFCPNSKYGCKTTLAMRDCDLHLSPDNHDSCLYARLPCPNACSDQNIFRNHLAQHCSQYCPRRRVTCPHCKEDGEYQEMTDEHPRNCLFHPLSCPQGCGVTLVRQDIPTHMDSCPLEIVSCPFSGVGCTPKVLRKDLSDHLTSAVVTHLTQLSTAHISLKNDCTILKKEYMTLQAEHEDLQEKHSIVETKLSNVGALILDLPSQFQQPSMVLSSLEQLNNVLVDTSKLAIGSSVSLAVSHCIAQGCHYIVTDKFRFQLQWSYTSQNVMFYFIPSMNASTLPHNWSCDFILKLDIENFQQCLLGGFQLSGSQRSVSSTNILAVICCGKSQSCKDDESSSTKILVGSL